MSYSGGRILLNSQGESQIARFRAWIMVVTPLAAILFQFFVPRFFPFFAFLDLPLLVVVYFSFMRRSQIGGIFIGALVGIAQDSLSKNPLGMVGIVKTLVGYFASSVGLRLDVDNVFIRLILTLFFFIFHQFFYWLLARALLGHHLAFEFQKTLVMGALNAVVGAAMYHFLDRMRERA